MRRCLAIVILVSATASGCKSLTPRDPNSLYELGEHLSRSVCSTSEVQLSTVENKHDAGQIDHIELRSCPEGSSEIYVGASSSNPQGLAMSVEIKAPRAGLPQYLEIGAPVSGAEEALGPPESQSSDALSYSVSQESPSDLTISVKSGRITSVKWCFYID